MKIRLTPLSRQAALIWALTWFLGAEAVTLALWKPFFHLVPFLAFFAAMAITAARCGAWYGIASVIAAVATLFGLGILPENEFFIRTFGLLANSAFIIWLGATLRRSVSESQAYQRSIGDAVADFVWSRDPGGRPLYVNQRMLDFFGMDLDEFDPAHRERFTHRDDIEAVKAAFAEGARTGEPIDFECRYKRRDGSYHWFTSKAVPTKNARGEIVEWIGTSTNIEVRKRAEMEREQLLESERRARMDAEQASRMKDEFLATLSHELRTPLNAIVGWVHLLKGGDLAEEELSEGLAIIERNTRVQTKLIEDLLDMSKIISGKIRLDVQSVDLSSVIEAAAESVEHSAQGKEIRLIKVLDSCAGEVRGDPARLQQILWNLLSNAIKFTPRQGRVEITLRRVASHMEITVSDSGEGIAPDFLPHIFERFRQADASTTRRHGGLGLGLAIVKQLVELHGGAIRAKSGGEGKGASFSITLPVPASHAIDTPSPAKTTPYGISPDQIAGEAAKLAEVRVLIVDDERDSREILQRVLERFGANVKTAASAEEALSELRSAHFDTLVSDISMPDIDGFELVRRVRSSASEFENGIPAIALTAFARPEDRRRAIQAGFDMFVSKPVDPAELATLVERCATRSQRDKSAE